MRLARLRHFCALVFVLTLTVSAALAPLHALGATPFFGCAGHRLARIIPAGGHLYYLDHPVGKGSYGIVLSARRLDPKTNRPIPGRRYAIKYQKALPQDLAKGGLGGEVEVDALLALHEGGALPPHIPRYYGYHLEGEHAYVVTDFVEGETFQAVIARGPVPEKKAAHIMAQIARALNHLKVRGLVHRDLKPANIQITPEGDAFLFDFGGSIRTERVPAHIYGEEREIIGTPDYSSAEYNDTPPNLTWRTDLWALGVTLYHAIEGKLPFAANTVDGTLYNILLSQRPGLIFNRRYTIPRPEKMSPRMRRMLSRILNQPLDPGWRDSTEPFSSPAEVAAELESIAHGQ